MTEEALPGRTPHPFRGCRAVRGVVGPDSNKRTAKDVTEGAFNRILVVDDEPAIRELLRDFLRRHGYQVDTATDGVDAVGQLKERDYDLIVTDLAMPKMDGFGVIREAVDLQPFTTIIVLSGQDTFENAVAAVRKGAYDFVAKPVMDFEAFKISIERGIERKTLVVQRENYQRNLETMVAEQTEELARTNVLLKDYADQLEAVAVSVITSLLAVLEEKDRYTAGHSRRVTYYAMETAKRLGVEGRNLWLIQTAAQLHDMGKVVVDASYVNKPGPLTEEEWSLMREHPVTADRFLAPLPFLAEVRPIIRHHHERLDGSGYPDGLKGDEIDLMTHILAVADSFDAMTSQRSYRAPMSHDAATAELRRCSGRLFHRGAVDALIDFIVKSEHKLMGLADL